MKKAKYVLGATAVIFTVNISYFCIRHQISKKDPFEQLVDIYVDYTNENEDFMLLPSLKGKTVEEVVKIYGMPDDPPEEWVLNNPSSRPIQGGVRDALLQDILANFHEPVTLYSCSWEIKENTALFVDFMKDKNGVYRVICALQYNYMKILWE